MAKMLLTAQAVEKLKPPKEGRAEYFDSVVSGFHLRVTPKGKKSWNLTYRYHNKSRRMMLGSYPITSLAEGREKARQALKVLENGHDPAVMQKLDAEQGAQDTVNATIDLFIQRYAKPKNRSWRETEAQLKRTLGEPWGDKPVKDISRKDIHALLDQMLDEGKTHAVNNAFRAMRRYFNWLAEREIIDASPCMYIKLPHKAESRDRIMSDDEVRRFWAESEKLGYPFGSCLQLLMLTGQRRSEVAELQWSELDLDTGLWCIPKERSKNGKAHEVPLSPAAVELLRSIPRWNPPYVFSTRGGLRPIQGFDKVKKEVEQAAKLEDWRIHDIRRTVASGCARLGTSRHVIEKLLNHTDRSVTAIYDRHSYLTEKREALVKWAKHLREIMDAEKTEATPAISQ